MAQYGQDPAIGLKILTNPQEAAAEMAARGIPPPQMGSDEPMRGLPDIIRTGRDGKIIGNLSDQDKRMNYTPEGGD